MKRRFYIEDVVTVLGCHGQRVYETLLALGMKPKRQRGHGRHNQRLTAEDVERVMEAYLSKEGEKELRRLERVMANSTPR